MKKNLLLFFVGIILFGCNEQRASIEDSDSLNIDSKLNKGNVDTLHIEKYKNGKISSKCNFKNGLQHGLCQFYFNSGILKEEGSYYLGNPIDTFKYYNEKGVLIEIRDYQIVKGKSLFNQFQIFGENGKIINEKSNYITLSMQNDTLEFGEGGILRIKLEAPYFKDKMAVVIGHFDAEYNLIDSLNYMKLEGTDFKVQYNIKPTKLGENIIRGIVKDYKKYNISDTLQARRNIYFTKKYFVISKGIKT